MTRKTAAVTALTALILGLCGTANAAPGTTSNTVDRSVHSAAVQQRTATRLDVTNAHLDPLTLTVTGIKAYLTDEQGQPLTGKTIYFESASGRELGTEVTDEKGRIDLDAVSLEPGTGTVQELLNGYDAYFGGDVSYSESTAHGTINLLGIGG